MGCAPWYNKSKLGNERKEKVMTHLPGYITGSVRNALPHLPPGGVRNIRASVDQFGNIGKFGSLDFVGNLDRFGNVKGGLGQIIGHLNAFGFIEPR
jgi:hypothetical protein